MSFHCTVYSKGQPWAKQKNVFFIAFFLMVINCYYISFFFFTGIVIITFTLLPQDHILTPSAMQPFALINMVPTAYCER